MVATLRRGASRAELARSGRRRMLSFAAVDVRDDEPGFVRDVAAALAQRKD